MHVKTIPTETEIKVASPVAAGWRNVPEICAFRCAGQGLTLQVRGRYGEKGRAAYAQARLGRDKIHALRQVLDQALAELDAEES